ncbi:HpcH/HpaI aldolase family protein [Labrys wisconsinensis]|uniref:4-hydroxy-2-oxoheptanedioate aldolase n=1 Tax=Labrys wisconsinensis TaxID=425677 RepID=A0ABU0J0G7_9HYPH|nr:aldolase/citrate lyase family protein [Labrys wisconsinensis]MDQ0467751.1 4-hydroxy-2-oxoheptanedioate aldolase [Labrys wisconsinensis]
MVKPNLLKRRLAQGEALFGAWIGTGSAVNAEILAHQGFDFLILDLEHGPGDVKDAADMLRAVGPATPCIVRVPWNDPVFLKRILDAGADSLMIPSVETAEEARAAVQACRYPPQGRRGYAAPLVRASTYGKAKDYMRGANDELLLIVQIESAEAVGRAAEIAAVDGVDVPFLGVNDMAGSIGRLEELDHPDVRALVARAEAAMRASGKPMGTVPSAGATWQSLFEAGYQLVPVASDVGLMRDAALACVDQQLRFRAGRGA